MSRRVDDVGRAVGTALKGGSVRQHALSDWLLASATRCGLLAMPLLTSACLGSYHEPVRSASSVDQAAAVLVTPTMVRPWRDVADALAPNFTMSGDAAVARVLPTTERVQDQVLRALGLSLGVGLPGSSTSSTNVVTRLSGDKSATDAAGVVTTSSSAENGSNSTSTETRAPGVAPAAPTGAPAGAALPASGAPAGDLGIDPVLQYKAANYLHQTVQLLNREVQAAAQRSCYEPYVVKLKLAVMPYRPNLGYDLHTRIGFFSSAGQNPFGPLRVQLAQPAAERSINPCSGSGHVPIVVPLLAADDLQMATRAKAIEEAQQIGLALSAMVSGVGANAGANRLNQTLRGILNHDLSSSLTVAREADNTLYVRIAANNVASGEPSLVGQTYDVAVLLLVPHGFFVGGGATTVAVETLTEFRHATLGTILSRRSTAAIVARANELVLPVLDAGERGRWTGATPDEQLDFVGRVIDPVERGDFEGFLRALVGPRSPCSSPCAAPPAPWLFDDEVAYRKGPALWTAFSALLADSAYKSTLIELPGPAAIRTTPQDVFLQDDGKETATAVVSGVSNYAAGSLRPSLRVTPVDAAGRAQSVVIVPAQGIAYDASMQALTLTFPSLAKLGLSKTAASGDSLELALVPCDDARRLCPGLNGGAGPASYPVRVVAAAPGTPKPAGFSLTPATTTIVIQRNSEGMGHAAIRVAKLAPGHVALISVSGAEVLGVNDGGGVALGSTAEGYPIGQNGIYTFGLRGLRDDATVTMTGQEMSGATKLGTTSVNLRATAR